MEKETFSLVPLTAFVHRASVFYAKFPRKSSLHQPLRSNRERAFESATQYERISEE